MNSWRSDNSLQRFQMSLAAAWARLSAPVERLWKELTRPKAAK